MQNKKLLIVLVLLLFVVVISLVSIAALFYLFERPPSIRQNTVVEVNLSGEVLEFPPEDAFSLLFARDAMSIWQLSTVFEEASKDRRVSGILLKIGPLAASWAQAEELRGYMKAFRRSGKPIHAYLSVDLAGEIELYLASAADSITINPDAGLMVNGLMAEVVFMKRTMEKLRIRPEFIQFKEYKNPETYTRTELTPEIRGMLESILTDIQDRFLDSVSEDRQILREDLESLAKTGLGTAQTGLSLKLVDTLGYEGDVQDKFGGEAREKGKFRSISASTYLASVADRQSRLEKARVAVVGASGTIIAGEGQAFAELMGGATISSRLRDIREDDEIDGVILRVNSPGGSAVGSDMVWHEVRQLEESGKPVVVTMSGVAGSGGYYISMGARHIVSQPSTITGSVGVLFGKFDLSGLYDWIGMDIDRVKLLPNADILSFYSSLSEDQRKVVEGWIANMYEIFVTKAAEGRGMSFEEFEPKAHGRIYTGAQALEEGLVDSLGGMPDAVAEMKKALGLAETEELRLELYPKPKTLFEALTSGDLLEARQPDSLISLLSAEFRMLETPAAWYLAPEIRIH